MALTASQNFAMGTPAPDFSLPNTIDGKSLSLQELKGEKGTAIFFICNHCPYVIHINAALVKLAQDYVDQGVSFIAISSNDTKRYPQDGPENMKRMAAQMGYPFPYLFDESQDVARAYEAACTPDLYLFDADLKAVYRGQFDDTRPRSGMPATGADFRQALDHLLAGKGALEMQRPSVGCSIKWK
ncbi:MAG: thioredoxin family protein [Bacteroidota bacterium]